MKRSSALSRYRRVAPVSSAYSATVIAVWILCLFSPSILLGLMLKPSDVMAGGQLWRLLSYCVVHSPASLLHPIFIAASIPLIGWYVEPNLGRTRTIGLLATSALLGSIGFLGAGEQSPFVGGAFVVVGYASALVVWAHRGRESLHRRWRLAWPGAMLVALYCLSGSAGFALGSALAAAAGVVLSATAKPRAAQQADEPDVE